MLSVHVLRIALLNLLFYFLLLLFQYFILQFDVFADTKSTTKRLVV